MDYAASLKRAVRPVVALRGGRPLPRLRLRKRLLQASGLAADVGVRLVPPSLQQRRSTGRPPAPTGESGTVVLPIGRYFAGRADLLTRDGFKMLVPIDDISPFTGVGDPDPEMSHFAEDGRVNDRVKTDVYKDLAARLAQADADFLVVDNTAALLWHRELNGRLYTVIPGEATDLTDTLWNDDPEQARTLGVKLSHEGLTDSLRSHYDAFVRACLASFDPARIVLVRSHGARFWIDEDGTIAPSDIDRRDARFLEVLDAYFVEQTGCRTASRTLGHFPSTLRWQGFDHRLRRAVEDDLVELCSPGADAAPAHLGPIGPTGEPSAADHVVDAVRGERKVGWGWLKNYFAAGGASYDDLVALAYLETRELGQNPAALRACVRSAVADAGSFPRAMTRWSFDRSLAALRRWWWRSERIPGEECWRPQITVSGGAMIFRFLADGSIRRVPRPRVSADEATAFAEGRLAITPVNVSAVLSSWPIYLERGRRKITTAPRVLVSGSGELVDSCAWLDWDRILRDERVVITSDPRPSRFAAPLARTDLSFLFEPNARMCTVGGGLMDQVTHIALFDDLCRANGLTYYIDDLRYTWWRSHNGFEASRLAPQLESRRITRLISPALIESFREEVLRTKLPWVFSQSRRWFELGLHEATVITKDYFNSRELIRIGPDFPVVVYEDDSELAGLIAQPPSPVCFCTTQQRIPILKESAVAVRRVFRFQHLESELDPRIEAEAERLRRTPHVAFHVRRGDYLHPHFDVDGWHSQQSHFVDAIDFLIESELGTSDFDVAVFSDDLDFVDAHLADYGLDRVSGEVRFIRGNTHFHSIYDAYLMSLCPIIVGSVGFFAATTSLIADPPSLFIHTEPEALEVYWRR